MEPESPTLATSSWRHRIARGILEAVPPDLSMRLDVISAGSSDASIDPFGMNLADLKKTALMAAFLYKYYFRCKTTGIENIPDGPVILVANHGGQIPINAAMITASLILEPSSPRLCRSLASSHLLSLPFLSIWFNRVGFALETPENAQRLLDNNAVLLMFPEGMNGLTKTLDSAYELQDFDPNFIMLALACNAPVIPVSVVGAEEQYPTLFRIRAGTRILGLPSIPIWAQGIIPILGLLPLPVKYHLHFGAPMRFAGDPDGEDTEIDRMVRQVRQVIQETTTRMREERKSVFL